MKNIFVDALLQIEPLLLICKVSPFFRFPEKWLSFIRIKPFVVLILHVLKKYTSLLPTEPFDTFQGLSKSS